MERILPARTPFAGVPYPGCAATEPAGSDSYPATVTWVSEATVRVKLVEELTGTHWVLMPKRIKVAGDAFRGVAGHSNAYTEDQRYVYYTERERDDVDFGREYSWRPKVKRYVRVGSGWKNGPTVYFGYRSAYRDPCV